MKKLGKRLMYIIIIGGVLFAFYTFFVKANGFTSEQDVVTSFITNFDQDETCDTHFNTETKRLCEVMQNNFDGSTVTFKEGRRVQGGMEVTLTVDDSDIDFFFTFTSYEPSGLRGILNSDYYLIDVVE